MTQVKVDYRELKNVSKTAVKASKAQSSAIKSAGYELQQSIKKGMRAQAPAGETWPKAHPWTAYGRLRGKRIRWKRISGRGASGKFQRVYRGAVKDLKRERRPLSRLVGAVRYRKFVDSGPDGSIRNTKVRIGFLSPRAAKLAEYHASEAHTQTVTDRMRKFLFAAGLGIKAKSIKIPRRRHVEPVWERNRDRIAQFVSGRVARAMAGSGARVAPQFK